MKNYSLVAELFIMSIFLGSSAFFQEAILYKTVAISIATITLILAMYLLKEPRRVEEEKTPNSN